MKKSKSVIIGCGGRAHRHAVVYPLDRAELAACCDIDKEKADAFAKTYGLKAYYDAREMLEAEKPDLVHLVTPPLVRAVLIELISEMNVPACLSEKPISVGVRDWKRICEVVKNTNTKFGVNHQFRFHKNLKKCRAAIESGKLGKVRFAEYTCGMSMNQQGTHITDYVMSLIGDPKIKSVFGTTSKLDYDQPRHPAPETSIAQVQFDNGVIGMWNTGYTAPVVFDDGTTYKHCREAVYCEKGWVTYEEFGEWKISSQDGDESGRVSAVAGLEDGDAQASSVQSEWDILNDLAQKDLTESMLDWMENDNMRSESYIEKALHQWNAVQALYMSSLTKMPVELPFDPPEDLFEQMKLDKVLKDDELMEQVYGVILPSRK